MKKFLFAVAFVVTASIACAQDKYEFMTINYESLYNDVCVSIDGETLLTERADLPKEEDKKNLTTNPLLKKVKEYQDKGWEVMTFDTYCVGIYPSYIAYLKKKKN